MLQLVLANKWCTSENSIAQWLYFTLLYKNRLGLYFLWFSNNAIWLVFCDLPLFLWVSETKKLKLILWETDRHFDEIQVSSVHNYLYFDQHLAAMGDRIELSWHYHRLRFVDTSRKIKRWESQSRRSALLLLRK